MKCGTSSAGARLPYYVERVLADSFPCPRCGDRIPADAGRESRSERGETVRHALCPSCKGPLVRANDGESPWRLED
jgi:hypothetical protein